MELVVAFSIIAAVLLNNFIALFIARLFKLDYQNSNLVYWGLIFFWPFVLADKLVMFLYEKSCCKLYRKNTNAKV